MGWAPIAADVPLDGAQAAPQGAPVPVSDPTTTPASPAEPPASSGAAPEGFMPLPADAQLDGATHAQPQDAELQGQAPILVTGHRSGPLKDASGRVILQDADALPQGQDTGIVGENGGTHTENDPRFAGANNAVQHMLKIGASSSDILDYLKGLGASDADLLSLSHQLGAIRQFQQQNPHYKGSYVVDLERSQKPNSTLQNVMGSDVGAGLTAAGNSTALVPKVAALLGADPNEVQTAIDASQAVHPKSAITGTIAGAAGTTLAAEEALAATGIPGLARVAEPEVAEGIAAGSRFIRPATANAAYGAEVGAASTDTNSQGQPATWQDRLTAAAKGAAAGVAGYGAAEGLGAGAGTLASRSAAAEAANRDFAQAADRQGISYMAADMPSATKSRLATSLANSTLGTVPISKAAGRNIESAQGAVGRVADDIGSVSDRTGGGQAAQSGARQFLSDTEAKESALHEAIPIPESAPANLSNTRSALSDMGQQFQSNPKLAAIMDDPKLAAYRDALTPQTVTENTGLVDQNGNPITREVPQEAGLSWGDLKDFRSRVGQIIGKPSLASDGAQIGQLRRLYASLSEDMRATAQGYGPQASAAFERANTYSRARADRIANVVSLILGKNDDKGAQSAFEALQRLGNEKGGDAVKLGQALRSMPPDEANSVRATMLDDMAHAAPGKQNDTGNAFSPADFVTRWNSLSDRAKSILFTGPHRDAMDDIVKVLSGMKASSQFANTSKTGLSVGGLSTIGLVMHNPLVGIPAAAGQYLTGSLLASPRFAKWMAALPKKPNVNALTDHINRLDGIAQDDPQIANDIMSMKQKLADVLQQGTKTRRTIAATGGALGVTLERQH